MDNPASALALHAAIAQSILVVLTTVCVIALRKRLKTTFGPVLIIDLAFALMALKRFLSYLVFEGNTSLGRMSGGVVPLIVSLTLMLGVSLLLREIVRRAPPGPPQPPR